MPLNQFKANFSGGTRGNRFTISGSIGGQNSSFGTFTAFHVRSTQIPQISSKYISYDHLGRKYYYPGEKEYGTWSFQVLDDNTGNNTIPSLWKAFQNWQNDINNHATNISNPGFAGNYKNEQGWAIHHLDINGDKVLKEYQMYGCWPSAIQPINFNMANPNVLNTFNVVIVYDMIKIKGYNSSAVTP